MADQGPQTTLRWPTPIGESVLVWAGAIALAEKRHPNAAYPQPLDVEDARTVLLGAVAIRPTEQTHG